MSQTSYNTSQKFLNVEIDGQQKEVKFSNIPRFSKEVGAHGPEIKPVSRDYINFLEQTDENGVRHSLDKFYIIRAILKGNFSKAILHSTIWHSDQNNIPYTKNGAIPLYFAAMSGDKKVFDTILTRTNDIDQPDIDGVTPLMVAAARGHKDIVHKLIESGCDVNKTDNNGNTALFYALVEYNTDAPYDSKIYQTITELLDAGASYTINEELGINIVDLLDNPELDAFVIIAYHYLKKTSDNKPTRENLSKFFKGEEDLTEDTDNVKQEVAGQQGFEENPVEA